MAERESRGRQQERSEATRAALMVAARRLFTERGYSRVGTEEIVEAAGITRGALYHHFRDKKALFEAVHEQVTADFIEAIGARVARSGGRGDPLVAGLRAFLDECTNPELMQIGLVDAPGVLGWQEWRAMDERYAMRLVEATLEAAMHDGLVRRQPTRPLAHLLMGTLGEAALMIANADDPAAARREVEKPLLALVDGIRARGT
jgi:AcrR family transcriptional regulator